MPQLATAAELASDLGIDPAEIDTAKANRKLTGATAAVESMTGFAFTPRSATVRLPATAALEVAVPLRPVRAVTAARIAGVAYADFQLTADGALWRARSWRTAFTPQTVELDVDYGMLVAPEDIKGVVLELAGGAYEGRIVSESIDDYRVQYAQGGMSDTSAQVLAAYGAGPRTLAMRGRG